MHTVHRGPELRSVCLPHSAKEYKKRHPVLPAEEAGPRARNTGCGSITYLWHLHNLPVAQFPAPGVLMDGHDTEPGDQSGKHAILCTTLLTLFFTLGNIHNKLGNSKKSWGQSWYMTPSKKEKKRKSPWHQNSRIKIATSNSCANLLIMSGEYKVV